jgi:hypothetical protein
MSLPNDVIKHILEFLRGDVFYRKRCVHTVSKGKRRRTCKHRPLKDSTFCAVHEKIFQRADNHWEALLAINRFMLR